MSYEVSRIVVVTGAAGGIGREICDTLSRRGDRVWRLDFREVEGERAIALDVTSPEAVDAAVARIVADAGRIDLLVNAVGVFVRDGLAAIDKDEFRRVFDVNVLGPLLMMKAAAPHMGDGSSIINIASVSGRRGGPTAILYSASKAALISATQSAALALAPRTRVNAIAPGPVDTAMWSQVLRETSASGRGSESEVHKQLIEAVPMKRIATTTDITATVIFLANESSYVTGQTVNVDGGLILS
ncbi:D-sorbitol dehydrogenase (acceptor) [Sphingomonas jinjuensis]|uniref:D-sorbitol dehydrogenase (Acceptor) n=1 Tax=Sphingomonas jinjuensis TaxID=535907 RepID=A0A840FH79_9SPHN|nr:SDR family oxidoreductase [Sphingomonas jinjuensis]MBB4155074.1 D-sorbitol dehydrogenase (acceptor) [Sphingomonas jinjuensis]